MIYYQDKHCFLIQALSFNLFSDTVEVPLRLSTQPSDSIIQQSIITSPGSPRRKIQVPNVYLTTKKITPSYHTLTGTESDVSTHLNFNKTSSEQGDAYQQSSGKENISSVPQQMNITFHGTKVGTDKGDNIEQTRDTDENNSDQHPSICIHGDTRRIYAPSTSHIPGETSKVTLLDIEDTLRRSRNERGSLVQFVSEVPGCTDATNLERLTLFHEPQVETMQSAGNDKNSGYQNLKRKFDLSGDFTAVAAGGDRTHWNKPPVKMQCLGTKYTTTAPTESGDYQLMSEAYTSDEYEVLTRYPSTFTGTSSSDEEFKIIASSDYKGEKSFFFPAFLI